MRKKWSEVCPSLSIKYTHIKTSLANCFSKITTVLSQFLMKTFNLKWIKKNENRSLCRKIKFLHWGENFIVGWFFKSCPVLSPSTNRKYKLENDAHIDSCILSMNFPECYWLKYHKYELSMKISKKRAKCPELSRTVPILYYSEFQQFIN